MRARKHHVVIAVIIALVVIGGAVAFWWKIAASNGRSFPGRVERFMRGEPLLAQRANDLAEDIRTIPSFTNLQPWAMETITRAREGTIQSNGSSPLYWTDTAVTLAPQETPEFIKSNWNMTNVAVVRPEIVVAFSPDHRADYLVINFWEYGVAVGFPDYRLSFYAVATNEVAPGIYTYYLSK